MAELTMKTMTAETRAGSQRVSIARSVSGLKNVAPDGRFVKWSSDQL
jgi:hypothetical protein